MRTLLLVLLTGGLGAMVWQATGIGGAVSGYPLVVTGGSVLFALACLATGLRSPVAGDAADTDTVSTASAWRFYARILAFVGTWAAYVALLGTLGFIVASWLALCISLLVLGGRLSLKGALGSAIFVAVLAVLLKSVLYVPVPEGWADVQLDVLLYRMR